MKPLLLEWHQDHSAWQVGKFHCPGLEDAHHMLQEACSFQETIPMPKTPSATARDTALLSSIVAMSQAAFEALLVAISSGQSTRQHEISKAAYETNWSHEAPTHDSFVTSAPAHQCSCPVVLLPSSSPAQQCSCLSVFLPSSVPA